MAKVKAHRSQEEAAASGEEDSWVDWLGKRAADRFAKRGAMAHTNADGRKAADEYEEELKSVSATMRWIGIALSQWPRASGVKARGKQWRREMGERRRARRRDAAARQGHDLAQSRDGWQCLTCGRSAGTSQGAKRLALSACKGHTACRVKAQGNKPSGHILWAAEAERAQTGTLAPDLIWCGRCGAYSSARVYNLAKECRGVPEKSARTRLTAINMRVHPILRHRLAPPVRLTDEVIRALGHGAEQRRRAFNELLRGDPEADARNARDITDNEATDIVSTEALLAPPIEYIYIYIYRTLGQQTAGTGTS